jgi:hypothetical protein
MTVWGEIVIAVAFPVAMLIAALLSLLGASPYGKLRLSELPGALWIVLAGKAYRTRLGTALAQRGQYNPITVSALERQCEIVPPSALEVRWAELGRQFAAGMGSINER